MASTFFLPIYNQGLFKINSTTQLTHSLPLLSSLRYKDNFRTEFTH
jgi:hypothetical protein